jgi:hypothetical protein
MKIINVGQESYHIQQITMSYQVDFCGEKKTICTSSCVNVYAEIPKFLETVLQKKLFIISRVTEEDDGGVHEPLQKKLPEDLNNLYKYSDSIAAYESHCTRKDSGMKFLTSHVPFDELYMEYKIQ